MDHYLYSVTPFKNCPTYTTLGPLPDDGMNYIILIIDNFLKFVGLYPEKNTSTLEFVKALMSWVGIFGVPKILKSDGGSQFSSNMAEILKYLLKYQHLIILRVIQWREVG